MALKKYSRTAQLIYGQITNCGIETDGTIITSNSSDMMLAQIEQGKTYVLNQSAYVGFFYTEPINGNKSYDNTRTLINTAFTAPITGYIAIRLAHSSSDLMFNEGSTSLPYAPYMQWNDISYRRYETATDTVTNLPVQLYTDGQPIAANLFNINGTWTKQNPSDTVTVSGNSVTITSAYFAYVVITVEPNTDYSLSYSGSYTLVRGYNSGAFISANQVFSTNQSSVSFNTGNINTLYILFYSGTGTLGTATYSNIMLNTGSTALPYQPYAPWVMKGNTETSGTQSPSSPVTINGTGNKTANLLPPPTAAASGEINGITYNVSADGVCTFSGTASASVNLTVNLSKQFVIPYSAPAGGQGTVAFNNSKALNAVVMFYNGNTQVDAWQLNVVNRTHSSYSGMAGKTIDRYIIQIPSGVNADGLTVAVAFSDNGVPVSPFEPYGKYKVSITSNGTTLSPVYLTEQLMKIGDTVDSLVSSGTATYNTYKLVLTGDEAWDISLGVFYLGTLSVDYLRSSGNITYMSTHYVAYQQQSSAGSVPDGKFGFGDNGSVQRLYVHDSSYSTVQDFKAFLAAQYANGTPVTICYIRATPTTESVTAPSIPTTGGEVSIDVDTTVKPSELDFTYHGWHSHQPKKKSTNLCNGVFEQNGINNAGNLVESASRVRTFIDVKPNTQYTFNSNEYLRIIYGYNGDSKVGIILDTSDNASKTYTFTTAATVNKIGIALMNNAYSSSATAIVPSDVQNAMLNEGSTALPYVPYWE
mgnify:CR=1 FL=1